MKAETRTSHSSRTASAVKLNSVDNTGYLIKNEHKENGTATYLPYHRPYRRRSTGTVRQPGPGNL